MSSQVFLKTFLQGYGITTPHGCTAGGWVGPILVAAPPMSISVTGQPVTGHQSLVIQSPVIQAPVIDW